MEYNRVWGNEHGKRMVEDLVGELQMKRRIEEVGVIDEDVRRVKEEIQWECMNEMEYLNEKEKEERVRELAAWEDLEKEDEEYSPEQVREPRICSQEQVLPVPIPQSCNQIQLEGFQGAAPEPGGMASASIKPPTMETGQRE